jgi:hypothetical protein
MGRAISASPACVTSGKPSKADPKKLLINMRSVFKSLGKLTLIQALKSTGYVCLIVFAINILVSVLVIGADISRLGSNLITNIVSWLWFGLFAIFESRKLENLNSEAKKP